MFGLGMGELIIILLIVVLIFGAGKLPELGNSLGKAIGNFKKATRDANAIDITPPKKDDQPTDRKS